MDSHTIKNTEKKSILESTIVTDIIVILDESGSMYKMGSEPVKSANAFLMEQKKAQENDDGATVTLVTFNTKSKRVIDNQKLSDINKINKSDYHPAGGTALNDTVCPTIKSKLDSDKPNNVVLLIISDGKENSSEIYTTEDTRELIKFVEEKHSWKVIFMGANIDTLAEGKKMNINASRCAQYDQKIPGDLLSLCRTASYQVKNYRRSMSERKFNVDLEIPSHINMKRVYTEPVDEKQKKIIVKDILTLRPIPLYRC